jgi:hypothetical protein
LALRLWGETSLPSSWATVPQCGRARTRTRTRVSRGTDWQKKKKKKKKKKKTFILTGTALLRASVMIVGGTRVEVQ